MPRKKLTKGIYLITNLSNGKVYVGQSIRIEARFDQHKSSLKGGYHENSHLQRAYNLYGADSFKFDILEECTLDVIDNRERHWISYYNSTNEDFGYNIEDGGSLNKSLSEETKKKISAAKIGRSNGPRSEETKRKIGEKNKGNIAFLGKTHSEETKRKMSEAKKYKPTQDMINDVKSGISYKDFINKYQSDTFKGQRTWLNLRKELGIKHRAPNSGQKKESEIA